MNDFSTLITIAIPLGIIVSSFLLGIILEKYLLKICKKFDDHSHLESYTIIVQSFQGVILIWSILGGITLALPFIYLPTALTILIQKIIIVIFSGSTTICIAKLAVNLIQVYSQKNENTLPLTSLFSYLTQVLIFIIGFLITIQSLGIKITALVAAFGIGSLSIGLAFQNTLTNLISGVNIIVSRKIRPGDYIELKNGEQGYVTDVELKYTVIKDINNNTIVIPNSQIIDASFKNYSLPEKEMLIPITIGVNYESDLEKVEQITLNIAKEIMLNIEGGVPEYEPFLRYEKMDYFAINFTIYLKIKEYYDQLIIKHEFIKKLTKTYQLEGIKIAFYPLDNYSLLSNKIDVNLDK